ncbi:MAG: chaperone modulator CbpM, partial [Odoribacter sp.]|nr:chaperone modulator CbpM [Odoribacter sp.]
YLLSSQINEIEKFSRMYYDLSINVEGISAINHLLERLKRLQKELNYLRRHLAIYQDNRETEDY